MQLIHLSLATDGRLPILPTLELQLAALEVLVRLTRDHLLLFHLSDDHLHLVLQCFTARQRSDLCRALGQISPQLLQEPHTKPVTDRQHLRRLVPYLLTQNEHHALTHPGPTALGAGSCFMDLVGGRVIGFRLVELLTHHLPRWSPAEAWRALELPPTPPANDTTLFHAGGGAILRAVCAAAAHADPHLPYPLRITASHLLHHHGRLTTTAVADLLDTTLRTVQRDLHQAPNPALERAARIRIAVRELLLTRALGAAA